MTNASASGDQGFLVGMRDFGRPGRALALGFTYWCVFDVVLGSGRIAHALRTGASIAWDQELIRDAGAGLLGAFATLPVLALARRFPIEEPAKWRRLAFHLAVSAAASAAMIAASCVLAPWLLTTEHRPFGEALRENMASSVLLLTFCMMSLVVLADTARSGRFSPGAANGSPPAETAAPKRVAVKTRAGLVMVETAHIDWIETQGNYLVLHVGPRRHLIRETSKRFEATLDPERFVRAHRQTIVAVDRISELIPLGSGDAAIRLVTGPELRVSRGYRDRVEARLRENAVSEPIAP